jgi:VanZ family protein
MLQWIPVIIYAGLIFYISDQPSLGIPSEISLFDPKHVTLHVLEYLPLGLLAARAASKTKGLARYNTINFSAALGVFYGLTDEAHQYFVPGRTASLWDVFADTAGVLLGLMLWSFMSRRAYGGSKSSVNWHKL